jgi:hypothetical protein
VFLGNILVADLLLSIPINQAIDNSNSQRLEPERAQRFHRIYASCVPEDATVVGQLQSSAYALGTQCLFTSAESHLRNDRHLDDRLKARIDDCDVFQLFWSTNSMHSPFVRREWEYALSLNRADFVRPVYWQEPLPSDLNLDLPPQALRQATFTRIAVEPDGEQQTHGASVDRAIPGPSSETFMVQPTLTHDSACLSVEAGIDPIPTVQGSNAAGTDEAAARPTRRRPGPQGSAQSFHRSSSRRWLPLLAAIAILTLLASILAYIIGQWIG